MLPSSRFRSCVCVHSTYIPLLTKCLHLLAHVACTPSVCPKGLRIVTTPSCPPRHVVTPCRSDQAYLRAAVPINCSKRPKCGDARRAHLGSSYSLSESCQYERMACSANLTAAAYRTMAAGASSASPAAVSSCGGGGTGSSNGTSSRLDYDGLAGGAATSGAPSVCERGWSDSAFDLGGGTTQLRASADCVCLRRLLRWHSWQ